MKKIFTIVSITLVLSSLAFGINIKKTQKNLEANLKTFDEANGGKLKGLKIQEIKSINNVVGLAIFQLSDGEVQKTSTFLVTENGDLFSSELFISDKKSMQAFEKIYDELAKQQNKELSKEVISKNGLYLVNLSGNPESPKSLYIFTDPNCPFCREDMTHINEYLQQYKEVHLLFVGVIKPNSVLKSTDIIENIKGLKKVDNNSILNIISKVYSPAYEPTSTQPDKEVIEHNEFMIKNNISSVPFKIEAEG